MSKMFGRSVFTRTSAIVLGGLLVGCGVEEKVDPEPIVLAQATPAEVVTTTTTDSSTMTDTTSSIKSMTNVKYGDAETIFRKGRYKEAAELFGSYVETHPSNAQGHYMLGLSAWKSGDRGRAEEALRRAVGLDSNNVKIQTNLGRVLLEQGRAETALRHAEKAVELAPESHEVWRVLGNVRSELGSNEEAIEAYREAIVRNEKDAWSMNNYGLVLIKLGRYEEALLPLARAVEINPRSPLFQNNLGVAFERSGYLGGARNAFSAAVEADSTFTKAKVSLERVQTRLGDNEGDTIDLSVLSQSFVEMVERWRRQDGVR
jgi:Tfp pilus assembly protein PilF